MRASLSWLGLVVAACLALPAATAQAQAPAQAYPTRPVSWVVGAAPGGVSDVSARMVAKVFGEKLGQPVLIDNKPGAGGVIATEFVAGAKPDGYTLLYGANGPLATAQYLYRKLSYDPATSFTPIHGLGTSPLLLIVPAASPFRTLQDLVAFARKNPGQLNLASAGRGTGTHLAGELLGRYGNFTMTHVPYKGSGPAMVDLLAGRVDLTFDFSSVVKPMIDDGRVRALVVTGDRRLANHPDVPTVAEAGYPEATFVAWGALVGPAKMPEPIVARLEQAFAATLRDPELLRYFIANGSNLTPDMDHVRLRAFIQAEQVKLKDVIERAGMTAE